MVTLPSRPSVSPWAQVRLPTRSPSGNRTGPVRFVLIGDGERPNGGLAARFAAGTHVPILGITIGSATPSDGAPVVIVSREYDGVVDFPAYPLNLLADLNALLGAALIHGKGYYGINPNAAGNIVTTSPDGNMTDILVTAAPGALPFASAAGETRCAATDTRRSGSRIVGDHRNRLRPQRRPLEAGEVRTPTAGFGMGPRRQSGPRRPGHHRRGVAPRGDLEHHATSGNGAGGRCGARRCDRGHVRRAPAAECGGDSAERGRGAIDTGRAVQHPTIPCRAATRDFCPNGHTECGDGYQHRSRPLRKPIAANHYRWCDCRRLGDRERAETHGCSECLS